MACGMVMGVLMFGGEGARGSVGVAGEVVGEVAGARQEGRSYLGWKVRLVWCLHGGGVIYLYA